VNKNIKAMRLCCRKFTQLAAPYLYRELWLYMHEDSYAKIKAIADHVDYRHMVERLKFFPKLLALDLAPKEDHESDVKALTYTGEDRELLGYDAEGACPLSQEQLDAGYVSYTISFEKQKKLRERMKAGRLDALISQFTKLDIFDIGFVQEVLNYEPMRRRPGIVHDLA